MKVLSTGKKSNINYDLFNSNVKPSKEFNPFKNEHRDDKNTGSNLLKQLQFANLKTIKSNSLFAAAVQGDPYAVWGITSQIRIG